MCCWLCNIYSKMYVANARRLLYSHDFGRYMKFICRSFMLRAPVHTEFRNQVECLKLTSRSCLSCCKMCYVTSVIIQYNGFSKILEEILAKDKLDETTYRQIFVNLCGQLSALSDQQLQDLIRTVISIKCKFGNSNFVREIASFIDVELTKRARFWSFDEYLVFFDLHSTLPLKVEKSHFIYHGVKFHQRKLFTYNRISLIKFMQIMNRQNLWRIYYTPKFTFEFYFNRHLPEFSVDEVFVFLEYMVKTRLVTNTPNLFEKICQIVMDQLSIDMPATRLTHFIQFVNSRLRTVARDSSVIDACRKLIDYLIVSNQCHAKHYIEVCTMCLIHKPLHREEFLQKFSAKFLQQFSDLTPNNIDDALKYFTFFGDRSKFSDIYDCVVTNMRRESYFMDSLLKKPLVFISILYHLSLADVYPYDMLDRIFNAQFLNNAFKKSLNSYPLRGYYVRGQELLTIDCGIDIECPDYCGNRLATETKNLILRYFCWTIPRLLRRDVNDGANFAEVYQHARSTSKLLLQVRSVLENLFGGSEFVHTCYLLPHLQRPNLLFALNGESVPQRLSSSVRKKMIVDRKTLSNELNWYTFGVLVSADSDDFPLRGTEITKVRQLKKLGFNVLYIAQSSEMKQIENQVAQILRTILNPELETENKDCS